MFARLEVLALVCMWLTSARAQDVVSEYQVKAAYLYNFAKFVEWPPESFASASGNFQICIFGPNPLGGELRSLTRDKAVNGHKFEVKEMADVQQARTCQILFIPSSQQKQSKHILTSLQGSSVLTVGESEGFANLGGMINFVLQSGRVRFEVNQKVAEQAGLKISAKLLSVAKAVGV